MSPAGRPKSQNPKEIRFSIRLDEKTDRKLSKYCKDQDLSKGEAIRRAIDLLLNSKSEA